MSASTAREPSPPALVSNSDSPALAAAVAVSGGVNRKGQPKKFHRILWDSDAATRGGKTSIGVLLEWLTAPGNYERWRDGKTQFGETREALCSQIKAEMARHGITHRENANIRTQMSELERSYDNAVAWLLQSGYDGHLPAPSDVTSGADVEAQVLRLCRYFHALDPIMGAAMSAGARSPAPVLVRGRQRRSTGTTGAGKLAPADPPVSVGSEDGDSEQRQRSDLDRNVLNADESPVATPADASDRAVVEDAPPAVAEEDVERRQPSVLPAKRKAPMSPALSSVSGGTTATTDSAFSTDSVSAPVAAMQVPIASPEPAPAAVGPPLPTGAASAGAPHAQDEPHDPIGHATLSPQSAASVWKAADCDPVGYGTAQRAMFEAAREERERKRFRMDEERNKLECEKLRYELQVAKLKLQVERALARKKLEKADLTPAEVVAAVEL